LALSLKAIKNQTTEKPNDWYAAERREKKDKRALTKHVMEDLTDMLKKDLTKQWPFGSFFSDLRLMPILRPIHCVVRYWL